MQTQTTFEHARPAGILVHLGAGLCSELDEHLARQPQRLLLIEADPLLAHALELRTAGMPQVEVRCATVAGQPGPAVFYCYNLPDAGSLHPASGLHNLFPGLKLVEQLSTESVSPVSVLEPYKLEAGQENILVIDLHGEELPVLEALRQADMLHAFREIKLYCGRRQLYEGGEIAVNIIRWLGELGYELQSEDDSRDPDRPCWTLVRSDLLLKGRELLQIRSEKETQENAIKELQSLLAEQQRQTEFWSQETDRLKKEAAKSLNRIEQMQSLFVEQQRQTEFWLQETERLKADAAESRARNELLAKEHQDLRASSADRDARIARIEEANEKAEVLALIAEAEHRQQVERLTQDCEEKSRLHQESLRLAERLAAEKQVLENAGEGLREELAEQKRQTEYWLQQNELLKTDVEQNRQRAEQLGQESQSLRDAGNALREELADQKRQTGYWLEEAGKLKAETEENRVRAEQLGQESQSLRDAGNALREELAEQKRQTEYWLQEAGTLKTEAGQLALQLDQEKRALENAGSELRLQLTEQTRQTEYWLNAHGRQQAEAESLKKRIEQLEQQYAEKTTRQRLMDEELLKAEAQIDLIKDILIREKAF